MASQFVHFEVQHGLGRLYWLIGPMTAALLVTPSSSGLVAGSSPP